MVESDQWLKLMSILSGSKWSLFQPLMIFRRWFFEVGGIIIWRIFSQDVVYHKELANLDFGDKLEPKIIGDGHQRNSGGLYSDYKDFLYSDSWPWAHIYIYIYSYYTMFGQLLDIRATKFLGLFFGRRYLWPDFFWRLFLRSVGKRQMLVVFGLLIILSGLICAYLSGCGRSCQMFHAPNAQNAAVFPSSPVLARLYPWAALVPHGH